MKASQLRGEPALLHGCLIRNQRKYSSRNGVYRLIENIRVDPVRRYYLLSKCFL